jgi:hypothetical protein
LKTELALLSRANHRAAYRGLKPLTNTRRVKAPDQILQQKPFDQKTLSSKIPVRPSSRRQAG